jgi:hypothetical protein
MRGDKIKMTKEQEMLKVKNDYDVNQIKSLNGLEAVRKRPGMYIGSTSQSGIDQLVYEVIDNSIDEYTAGFGENITIHVHKDGTVTSTDEGRGIPVGTHPEWKNKDGSPQDTLTGILTRLHAGGKFGGDSGYKCFVENSPVITSKGVKKISEVVVGCRVKNCYNESDEVSEVYSYDYDGDVNSIVLKNDKKLSAINGHYVLIKRNDTLYWEKIENVTKEDFLIELEDTDDVEQLKKEIPIYDKVKF